MDVAVDCVLGMPFLTAHNPSIDWALRTVTVRNVPLRVASLQAAGSAASVEVVSGSVFERGIK